MKKRKTFTGMILLIAVLVLGVGYAAITDINLTINGSASADASNSDFSVKFDKTVTPSKTETLVTKAEIDATDTTDLTATMEVVGLTTANNEAQATFTIRNYSADLGANLSATVYNEDGTTAYTSDYFTVTPTFAATSLTKATTATDNTTVTVTAKLVKAPVDTVSTKFKVKITAEAVES